MVETSPALLPIELLTLLEFQPDESLYVLYAHMDSSPAVSIGEVVEACQPLGEVGMTGNTELPHLHLETRLGPKGSVFESMRYYDTRATMEELSTYELWRTSGVYRHFDPMILLSPSLESFLP
jgi:murein DD-endopeptidase MepM/ murein hydrolase activator NlpD